MDGGNFLPSKKTAELIGVHPNTLRRWEKTGNIQAVRTPSGQRLYNVSKFIKNTNKKKICYCRVSSYKQINNLNNQIKYLQNQFPEYEIYKDIGSGINYKRKNLQKILKEGNKGCIEEIVVTSKDRLCRFGFELFEYLFELWNIKLVVLEQTKDSSPEEELAKDVVTIITVFGNKINGSRRYIKNEKNQNIS